MALGWHLVRDLPAVRHAFQSAFAELDADREPSPAHRQLARLIHEGRVQLVISYNWDSCLERAYQDTYGTALPDSVLIKPHGDVLAIDQPWILPDEDGLVPPAVLDRLHELDDRPRTLLVLGYSGSDQYVVDTLLTPLENKWPVYKIGPSVSGSDAVPTSADGAVSVIADRLLAAAGSSGWRYVVFGRSRGFEAALRGERLRPVDVDACPELPYAKTLAARLAASRFATLSGGSGTGKSVTAFHAARRLNQGGWTVVELTRTGVAGTKEIAALAAMPGPVLAVVDDAQALDPDVVAEFQTVVDDEHAVLLVSTERLEDHNDETVSDTRAKELIYRHCIDHLAEVEPKLMALDDRVGPGMMRESALRRLHAANASSRDPWSFMFVASGGERRIEGILDRLAETPEAALLLGAVAVGQLTSLDAGVPPEQAAGDVAKVNADAFGPQDAVDAERFTTTVGVVVSERLMRDSSGRLRTAHIRVADRALMDLARRDDPVGAGVRAIVRSHLANPDFPLHGKYWVLDSFTRSDSLRYRWPKEWLDEATVEALVMQALTAGPGADRSSAALVLSELAFTRVLDPDRWAAVVAQLICGMPDVDDSNVYSVARLLSHLSGAQPDLYDELRASLSAGDLAKMFSARGTRRSAPGWADLLRQLTPKHDDAARPAWCAQFTDNVDVDAMSNWLSNTTVGSHNDEITQLIDVLAGIAPAVAVRALRACAAHMRYTLEANMASATHGFARWTFGTMGVVAHVAPADGWRALQRRRASETASAGENAGSAFEDDPLEPESGEPWEPPPEFRDLAAVTLEIMEGVDWAAAAASLNGRPREEFENLAPFLAWLAWLSTELIDQLADAITFAWLDQCAATLPCRSARF